MKPENFLWVEKYRPQTIEECVLPVSLKSTFSDMVAKGEPQNLLFSGTAGVGKTTVAKALCNEMGCDWIIINCSEEGNIDTLRTKIRQFASTVSLSGDAKKVVILDEFDYSNCFSGEQQIIVLNDDGSCDFIRLDKLVNVTNIVVPSYNFFTKEVEKTTAIVVETGTEEVFEVEFEDGTTMICTENHPFFDTEGNEIFIKNGELFSINLKIE